MAGKVEIVAGPETIFSAYHDGEGWCVRAECAGEADILFGCYADTAQTAQWLAEQCATSCGGKVRRPALN